MEFISSNELSEIIARNIQYYRKLYNLKKEKLTQENLAELAEVSTALIGNLESKKTKQGLSVYTLWKISQVLEVPIEKFFDSSDPSTRPIE